MDATIPSITPEQLAALRSQNPAALIIDVRREAVFSTAPDRIAGAQRQDPAKLTDSSSALPPASRIVVYCVHGHEVSQNAARLLLERGHTAQYLQGGIEAWRSAGGALEPNNHK